MAEAKTSTEVIVTGGKVHERSHLIARILLGISFFVIVPITAITFGRFIDYREFFIYLGVLFAFGFLYYFALPAKYIPRYGYLAGDFIFYVLLLAVTWQIHGFVGFHLLFFYMLLFGIINALSYNWRDIIITILATSTSIVIYNFYNFMSAVEFSSWEVLGLTSIELIILSILTVESRVLADEALVVQKKAVELQVELGRLQELDRLKTEFIGVASHQMRTPLSGIKWALASLKETALNLNEEQKNTVGMAFEDVNRMITIVSGMLDVVKVEEQASLLRPETFELKNLVGEIAEEQKLLAAEKKIAVEIKIPWDITMAAVRQSLKQALSNVIDNALRYSNKPNTQVTVSASVKGPRVTITVSDQGIGMSEEQTAKVFTKFFRAPEAIKASPDGSGLGLYYTKRIIEQHGGSIKIESAPNVGTTVFMELPLTQPKTT
ncbi:MAG: HAMP domain-containing sensor histidine kinase [Candidatus Sungiibacteriota bacterium]